MVDFIPGRAVIDAAQRKRGKYMAKCAAIGYGFLPFSFSSLGELEAYAITLLMRIRKFSMAQDIRARAAVHIFNMISFAIAKSAFLNGDLDEEFYVTQPEGYVNKNQIQKVFKLFKALYGLLQEPRAWNVRLDKIMKGLGFLKSSQDPTVYTRNSKGKTLIVGVYVDDLIITGSHTKDIVEFKEQMKNEFEMSDLLEQFGMQYCNPTKSPMEPKLQVDNDEGGEEIDSTEYRRLVGCLSCGTYSEIYIRGTLDYGINYKKGSEFKDLVGFTDSDHGGDPVGGKSTGGMIFYLGRNAITWQSQKQKTVALSSCEAEFMAATSAACQAIWLANLVKELTGQDVEPITLFVDNKSAIALMKNPVFHGRSKHINIRFHFIRECVEQGKIIVEHVNTKDQRADLFTKALALVKFIEMRNKLGLTDTEPGPV
ncbi:zinc finger, CCHC-type containing protein [Tanacetum coccineum]|uniref:Zinc finger, CCHC-type containing protein n=1 Tax=Tanacetum coccineum TaxID=301880 RepID=A0ABQ5C2A5_9ASTR